MQLTQEQAYHAMYAFLDKQFALGNSQLSDILSSMSLLQDGTPADSALASDWLEAVQDAVSGKVDAMLRLSN